MRVITPTSLCIEDIDAEYGISGKLKIKKLSRY